MEEAAAVDQNPAPRCLYSIISRAELGEAGGGAGVAGAELEERSLDLQSKTGCSRGTQWSEGQLQSL